MTAMDNAQSTDEKQESDAIQTQNPKQLRETMRMLLLKLQRTDNAKEARLLSEQLLETVSKLPK